MPAITRILTDSPYWVVFALSLVAIIVFGVREIFHFSWRRTWAISTVCFAESYRRRVLLITPLAMIGVVLVSQLTKPIDEADAIRQTTKFAIFASGMVMIMAAVILASTNLPREIENRVIFTVVTKPTTRLELVLGKIVGFARVTALILLAMGVFTLVYLHIRSASLQRDIKARLETDSLDSVSRPTLEYYRDGGLLLASTFAQSDTTQVYSAPPARGQDLRSAYTGGDTDLMQAFDLTPENVLAPGTAGGEKVTNGLLIRLNLAYEPVAGYVEPAAAEAAVDPEEKVPFYLENPANTSPSTAKSPGTRTPLSLRVQMMGPDFTTIVPETQLTIRSSTLTDPTGKRPLIAQVPAAAMNDLLRAGRVFVVITPSTPGYIVRETTKPVTLFATPAAANVEPREIPVATDAAGKPVALLFRGRAGSTGVQVAGPTLANKALISTAVVAFSDAKPKNLNEPTTFEMLAGLERSGADASETDDDTRLEARVYDRDNDKLSPAIPFRIESNRRFYFSTPPEFTASGNFDVQLRCLTPGHFLNLRPASLATIVSHDSFHWNLLKSLGILWMLSVMVVAVAVFCSTFLSWPIAVVLTLMVLFGHWGVEQLGDSLAPGNGRVWVTDMFGANVGATAAKTVSTTIDKLSASLKAVSKVLPDVSQFAAIDDIERGVSVASSRLLAALVVLGTFGVPMVVLAFIFLKYKEVAP